MILGYKVVCKKLKLSKNNLNKKVLLNHFGQKSYFVGPTIFEILQPK
jgi:hypothetical protein